MEFSPEQDPAQFGALTALLRQGRLAAVLEQGEPLAARHPRSSFLQLLLGSAHAGLGHAEPAIAHFNKALEIKPEVDWHSPLTAQLHAPSHIEGRGASPGGRLWYGPVSASLGVTSCPKRSRGTAAAIRTGMVWAICCVLGETSRHRKRPFGR